jgi:hypothetical protein
MQPITTNHARRHSRQLPVWLLRAGALAVTVALLALATPVIWAAVSAGLGLVALASMAALGAALFQAIPLGLQRLENHLLKLRKAQARANPTEQLQNEVLRRAERLLTFRHALATVGGQIESITQTLAERRHLDPGHVLERQQRALQRLAQFHGANLRRLDEAQLAMEAFRDQVRQKVVEWEISLAIEIAGDAINPGDVGHLTQDMLADEALRAVQDRFNTAFAELDLQMRAVDAPTRSLLADAAPEVPGALALPAVTAQRRSA